jgi:hypothetical protein
MWIWLRLYLRIEGVDGDDGVGIGEGGTGYMAGILGCYDQAGLEFGVVWHEILRRMRSARSEDGIPRLDVCM